MKKILALVAVIALVAFAAPAFAAANPFMDVPMNHWAYDAIGQLASRGVLSGYPDGTYKGNQPMTRYEVASAVARALAVVDMTKASKQDVEMLKKLVVEFKDELDALGVKVDKLDSRVAVLEDGVGGWKFWGEFRMDAKWAGNDGTVPGEPRLHTANGDTDFNLNRYRIWMRKKVDDKVTFTGRLGGSGNTWQRYYVTVQMPWDVEFIAGLYLYDWEGDDGLYVDNDAMYTDRSMTGFWVNKNFAMGNFSMFAAHREGTTTGTLADPLPAVPGATPAQLQGRDDDEGYEYGARVKFNFNENFWLSGNYIQKTFDARSWRTGFDSSVWWAAAGVKFSPNWELKGAYYNQKDEAVNNDNNTAWKAILDVKQDALKFTSLWLEYISIQDANFMVWTDEGAAFDAYSQSGAMLSSNWGLYDNIMFVRADQKWNDTWRTFVRYLKGNARGVGAEDTTNYTFGVKYYYTPALSFELAYDKIEGARTVPNADDHVIRLRTHVVF